MPLYKCAVAACRSHSKKAKSMGEKIVFHSFPTNQALEREWIKRCHRKSKLGSTYKKICCKHFTIDDYEDAIPNEKAKAMGVIPKRLKRDAVPHLNLLPNNVSGEASKASERKKKSQNKQTPKPHSQPQEKNRLNKNKTWTIWQYHDVMENGKIGKTVKVGVVPHVFEGQQSKQGIAPEWEGASKRKTMPLVEETSKTISTLISGAGTVAIAAQEDFTKTTELRDSEPAKQRSEPISTLVPLPETTESKTTELQRDSEPAEQRSEPIRTPVLLPDTTESIATKSAPTPRWRIYCRLCMKPTNKNSSTALCVDDFNYPGKSHTFKKKKLDEVQEILKMLKFCLPFFDPRIFNPVLCSVCLGKLKDSYAFSNECLKNQQLIEKYIDIRGSTDRIVNIAEIIETKFTYPDEKNVSPIQTETHTVDFSKHLKNSTRKRKRRQTKSKKCLDEDNIIVKKRKICHESQNEDFLTTSNILEALDIKIEPDTDDKSALMKFLEHDILDKEIVDSNNISQEEIIKIKPSSIKHFKNSTRNRSRPQIKSKKCLDKDNIAVKKRKICQESQDGDSLTYSNEETSNIKIETDTDGKSALMEFLEHDILEKEIVDPNNITEEEIIKIEPSCINYPDLIKTEVEDDVHVKNELLCDESTSTGIDFDLEEQIKKSIIIRAEI